MHRLHVDVFHPARRQVFAQALFGRDAHNVEPQRLSAALLDAEHGLRGVVERESLGRHEGEAELGMQEAPAAHEAFARILAVGETVDRRKIRGLVAVAGARRRVLAGIGLRILDPIRRGRMRGQEIEQAWIGAGAARGTQA